MVKKSFLKCGISIALDGSEDDAIFEESEKKANEDDNEDDDDNDNNDYYDDFQTMEEDMKEMKDFLTPIATQNLKVFRRPALHMNWLK